MSIRSLIVPYPESDLEGIEGKTHEEKEEEEEEKEGRSRSEAKKETPYDQLSPEQQQLRDPEIKSYKAKDMFDAYYEYERLKAIDPKDPMLYFLSGLFSQLSGHAEKADVLYLNFKRQMGVIHGSNDRAIEFYENSIREIYAQTTIDEMKLFHCQEILRILKSDLEQKFNATKKTCVIF